MKKLLFITFILVVVLPLGWFFFSEFEGRAPVVEVALPSPYLKQDYTVSLRARDVGTGLRHLNVALVQAGKEVTLLDKHFQPLGYQGLFMGSQVLDQAVEVPVAFKKFGMQDGEAVLKIIVSDYSWRGWNRGNTVTVERTVTIDTRPPRIEVLTTKHNVTRGGVGLIVYRLFEDNITSGVVVGDNFFPGHPGMFKDKNVFAAFFALSFEQGPGTEMKVKAEDLAGNVSRRGFFHYIRDRKFKTDTLNISQGFLAEKIPEFDVDISGTTFDSTENPLLAKYLYINTVVRKGNVKTVLEPVKATENTLFWKNAFLRLPGSANRANFADHRIYKFNGKEIDRQIHMGIDLASVSRAPVPAANNGRILATEHVGIFGNTVLIDHGFGLTTLYAHLSAISVSKGDIVKRGDIIGKTGETGLAGGDHLHFGVAVNNVFVNPVEWWDTTWIKNNIEYNIKGVETQLK
ncbi:peptidase M23/M37 family protein [Desulforapulum autotrophicum HRM2]|uniref:Peptidase M23/M37 family protein n=1 Tax=Desulforapulum autotrophicum (strain ATCC 43914 / DSM 3382 / VKM B-1955 / HRM2) TaxID=177437 RepID=C0QJ58_DESAH|nr:M23 family metallopeptidase [Desulforapulum autotrophicum]ACN15871.1 peptidase M23/M37 family protein [Desulforapulum autotrophicum HRM2]